MSNANYLGLIDPLPPQCPSNLVELHYKRGRIAMGFFKLTRAEIEK